MKTIKMRGQAFIVFKDTRSAANAINGGHNVNFFGKAMDISYAKTKSKKLLEHQGKLAQAAAINNNKKQSNHSNDLFGKGGHRGNRYYKNRMNRKDENNKKDQYSRLRIEDVPINPNLEEINKIFGKFPGFVRVLYDESKPGICFVEYSDQNQSLTALDKLNGFEFYGCTFRIVLDNFRNV